MESPIWKIWTFPFIRDGREVAMLRKRWGGLLTEALLDKDMFTIEFNKDLTYREKALIIAAGLFVDLQFFESKAGRR
jgi:hypothetical protein